MTSKTWIGTTGTFETPGSWAPATVPGALDDVTISNAGADLIVQAATSATTTINSLHLAANDILDVETGDFDILDNVNTVDAFGTSENDGLITAAQLLTIHGTLLQSATGTIALGTTGLLSLLGTIAGGTIEATDAQSVQIGPGAVGGLDGVAVDAPVFLYDGGQLDLLGDVVLGSTLQIADSPGTQTVLDVDAPVATLSGAGVVSVSGTYGNDQIVAGVAGATLDILGVEIEGGGSIGGNGLVLDNAGIIAALFSSPMTIDATSVVNTGTILAQGSTSLLLDSSVTNTGGTVQATGTGGVAYLDGGQLTGGTLLATNGGTIFSHDESLIGVTLSGGTQTIDGGILDGRTQPVVIEPGTTLVNAGTSLGLLGTIEILGTLLDIGQSSASRAGLYLDSAQVSLTGTGVLAFGTSGFEQIEPGTGESFTLFNAATIAGAGTIDASSLVNTGTIIASGGTLSLDLGTLFNAGLIVAENGFYSLALGTAPIVNTGGTLAVAAGVQAALAGDDIIGGTLAGGIPSGGGVVGGFHILGNATLDGVTNASYVLVGNNATLVLDNSLVDDVRVEELGGSGTIAIGTTLVSLSGTGDILLLDNAPGAGIEALTPGNTLVNSVRIAGEGTIGGNGLVFRNSGYVSAYGGETLTFIGTVDNTGGLIAAPSVALGGNTYFGTVDLNGVNLTGGILDADGGTINGSNAILAGATFDGGGGVLLSGGVLDGTANPVFIYAGTTVTNIAGSALGLKGSIDVEGTLLGVGQSASTETFRIESPEVYLTGTGVLALGDSPYNYIVNGGDGSYTLHNTITIAGAGTIGAGNLYLVNTGVINADASTGGNGALTLDPATLTNSGLIEATGTAGLYLAGTVFNTGGTIGFFIGTFTGPGVILEDGSEIIGGTIDGAQATEDPGFLQNVTLDNVTVDGTGVANNAIDTVGSDVLHILDDIDNRGFIYVDNASTLSVDSGVVTLDGGGQVSLGAGANDIVAGLTGATLDNVDNLISVGADQSGTIGGNGLVLRNTGTVAAYSSASVTITGPVFNAGGTLLASGTDALINLNGIYLSGGVLSATGGMINAYNAATLVDTTFTGVGIIQLQGGTLNGQAQPVVIEAGTTLTNAAGSNLYVAGTIDVLGTLLGAGADDSNENLAIQGPGLTLIGSGVVAFDDSSANRILADSDGGTLPLYNFVTITGAFSSLYNVDVTNAGTIDASGTVESYLDGIVTNTGVIEATGTGGLALSNTVINTGGTIAASGTGAFDELAGATIIGGALTSSNGGSFDVTSGVAVLEDVTNLAAITVGSDGTIVLKGSLGGSGAIVLTHQAAAEPHLIIEGSVELSGGGTIELLTGDTNATVTGGMGGVYPGLSTLVIDQDFAIIGGGRLGDFGNGISNLTIVNSGTIAGTAAAYPMIITSSMTNAGLIEALAGTQALQIDNTVENTAGTILAAAGTVQLINVLVVGGTLATAAGGVVEVPFFDGATLDGVQNTGSFLVNTDAVLTLQTSLVNDGILELFATTSRSSLLIDPGVMTLSGGGTIELLGTNHNAIIEAASTAATLDNVDNVIAGIGTIGDHTNLTLLNAGTIAATGTSALVINPTVTVMTNTGLLEAVATGGLDLSGTILNSGGTIAASGAGAITELAGVTVIGGTLDSAAGGRLDVTSGTAVLDDVTNLGAISVGNGGELVLIDSLANSGTIVGSGSAFDLVVGSSVVTLTGAGTIEIASTVPGSGFGALITGQTLFNADNLITGGGTIGVGAGSAAHTLALINAGTIIASYALQPLTIDATSLLNSGVIEQTGAGRLVFDTAITNLGQITAAGTQVLTLGGTIVNEGGTLIAAAGGTFALSGADVQGGLITGPGSFTVADSTFDGSTAPVTIANATSVTVVTGETLALLGSLDNAGTLALPATSGFASLAIDPGEAVVSGGGTIVLLEKSGIAQIIANGSATLDNVDNLITGGGYVGSGTSLSLINTGTIAASSGVYALTVSAALGVTNAGLIEATTGAGLAISGVVQNGGGTIAAFGTGAEVDLAGLVSGGLLTAGNGGILSVPFNSTATLAALTNAATFVVSAFSALDLEGSIVNAGTIVLLATETDPSLVIDTTTTLSGGGVIDLGDGPARNYIATGTSATTLYNLDNTIVGGGYIGDGTALSLTNAGTIAATGTTSLVFDSTVTVTTNTGLLEAVNTGGLDLAGTILNTGGTIAASGAGAITELAGATIIGGTLDSAAGGVLDVTSGTAVLDDVTNLGAVSVGTGGELVLIDSLANSGTIIASSAASAFDLVVGGSVVTLTGAGTIEISSTVPGSGFGALITGQTLFNADNIMTGGGTIGVGAGSAAHTLALINAGTIIASDASEPLTIDATSLLNTGVIETGGGQLVFDTAITNLGQIAAAGTQVLTLGGTIANAGGTLVAAAGGTFALSGADVQGGLITGPGSLTVADSTFDGSAAPVIIANATSVTVGTGETLALLGSLDNAGALALAATSGFASLAIDPGEAVVSGGGTIVLLENSGIAQIIANGSATLDNVDNLITGGGYVGSGTSLSLINTGTIAASSGVYALNIDAALGVTNQGLIEATTGAGLAISGVVQNGGGTIAAFGTGANVDLAGLVSGGLLTAGNGGVIAVPFDSTLTLAALTNAATLEVSDLSALDLEGSIVNAGAIVLLAAQAEPSLVIDTTTTLSGGGIIDLGDGPARNYIATGTSATTLYNLDNTIIGGGYIGDGTALSLTNAGTIAATGTTSLVFDSTVTVTTNTGLLEAVNTGGLELAGTILNTGGTIAASGAGAITELAGATIIGGTLDSAAGGVLDVTSGTAVLEDVLNLGAITVGTGGTLVLEDSLANAGEIVLTATGTQVGEILVEGSVALTGGGTIELLTGTAAAGVTGGLGGISLAASTLNNVGDVIAGGGHLGSFGSLAPTLSVINAGTIAATDATYALLLTASVTNTGLIEALGGTLQIGNGAVNTGGTILAAAGTVAVTGGTITGGTIAASGSGATVLLGASEIAGATLANGGGGVILTSTGALFATLDGQAAPIDITAGSTVAVPSGGALYLFGSIVNHGVIFDDATGTAFTDIVIDDTVTTLSGGGTLGLSDNSYNHVFNVAGTGGTLVNLDNLIEGAGQIGSTTVGRVLGLINAAAGTIDASDDIALVIRSNGGPVINAGLMEATGSGGLAFYPGTTLQNAGGTLLAAGGTIGLAQGVVLGGTFASTGSGVIAATASAGLTLTGITNTGVLLIGTGDDAAMTGSIVNSGTVALAGAGATLLIPTTGASFSGQGTILLAGGTILAGSAGGTLDNLDNLITGGGTLGDGTDLVLLNAGTIAGGTAGTLAIDVARLVNTGVIETTGAAGIAFSGIGTLVDAGGVLAADAAAISLAGIEVQGGTLSGAAGFSAANSTLDGAATPLTLAAGTTLGLAGGSGVTLLGTIAGAGTLLAGASGTDQDLILGTPTIVFGATLGLGGTDSFVTTDAAGNTLINTGVMIGYGTASAGGSGPLTLINENLIDADGAGGAPVVFETGAVINAGVIEATGAGIFLVESTITDAGGTLLAAGGTLAVGPGGDLVGGQLTASAGGLIVVGGTGTLDGSATAPVTIASAVTVTDGSTLDLLGTIDLDATLLLASSETGTATGIVLASPTVTLADGGTLALSASTGNLITGLAGQSETLVNTGAVIAGAGTITAGAGGALTVLNGAGGVIDATGSLTLAGGVILDNAGLLEATGTGDLILGAGLTLSNAGGTVLADGGTVSLAGVVVAGGSLAVGGGGVLDGTGATLDGSTTPVTIAAGTSLDGSDLTLLGTIAILGTLGLAGFVPGFVGSPTLTLIGGGQLVLAPGGTFLGAGETLGTLVNDVTISGSGVIGYDFANSAALGLINTAGGVIDADVAGAALQLGTDGAATTNSGLIEATAGGTLDIATFTTLAEGPTGTLLADGGTVTIGEASVITGGSLLAASGGVFLTTGATLDGTAAPLTIGAGAAVTVSDGTVLDLSGTIDLPGTVVLGSGAALLGDAGATEVAAAGGLIAGDGTIGLAGGTSLRLDEGTTGTIAATGTLSLGAGVQVVGGTLTAGPGGTLVAESATLDGSTTPVTIAAGTSLDSAGATLLGTIALLGTLGVDGFSPGFVGSPTLTLGGGGQLALSTDGTAFLGAAEPPGTLVNAGVTITGAGVIGYDFANSAALGLINTAGGVIDAEVAGAALQISTNGAATTNAGLIEATGGGTLDIETFTTLAQSATGTLLASGGTVVIEEASVVTGGSLLAGAGGTLVLTGFSTLQGGLIGAAGGGQVIDTGAILDGSTTPETIAAGAVLSVPDGLFLEVLGTLDNAGTIAGLATAATGFTDVILTASPTVTLTGGGLVLLSDSPTNRILNASTTPATLVNVDNTIAGAGQIGSDTLSYQLGLINEADGVIDATGSNALVLAPNGIPVINAGVLEASGTGTLSIKPATTIDNAGGTLLAAGGTVLLGAGVDIAGGTLAASGAGQFIVSGLTLDGSAASLIDQAALAVAGGDSLSVLGTIANAAAITLGSGTLGATLLVDGTALLTGGGTVTFGTVAAQAGLVAAGVAGAALTVADETLQGSFTLGSGLGVTLGAAGVLESTGLLQLATGTAPIVNGGTIEASSGATLAVGGTLVSAAGGVITPNGGTVDFAGADLIGGTVGLGAGVLHVTGDSLFDERSAAGGNQGVLQIDPQATLALAGAFDNVATLALGAGGAALLGEAGTLQGGGTVTLQTGDTLLGTLLNLDNLIIGAGTVAGELGLGAAAKLVATGSLALTGSVANGGLLEAAAGGTLALGGTVAGGGTIAAVAGGLVTLAGDVIGGTLASGSGTITVAGLATLDGTGTALVNTGVLTIQSGATLDLLGTLAAAGSLVVGGTLLVGAATTLANTGLLALLPGGVVEGGALLNLTTIAGAGQLGGGQFTLINAAGATIAATTGALTVEAGNGTIGNAGLLAAEGFALSVSAGGFANTGTVAALGAGLTVQANVAPGGTLAGGTWIAAGGATLTLGGTTAITDDAARIVLSGTGSALTSGPNATSLTQSLQQIDAGGTLTLGTGTRFAPAGALANAGTLLLAGGTLAMGGTTAFVNSGLITGAGSVTGTIANAGTIAALARNTLQIGPVTGGTLLVGGGADLVLTGAATGGTVDFTGPGTLTIGAVGSFSETIAGFGHGDIIDLAGIGAAGSLAFDPATDVLTLYSVTSQAGTVAAVSVLAELQFAGTLTANDFGFRADATGQGTDVVPCFVAGTRLQSAVGEVAVERLQPGDRVVTPSGLRPVVWRGARRIACARHPRPELVRPVRVAADAFGPGLPARDLRLSPDHAVEWQGVLIPVRCLVNGATIRQEAVDTVHYVHVELDAHDLVQAEGLWTESYLDTGNRGQFEGAAPWQSLHAAFDGDAMHEGACRPWRETGPEVSTAREMLRQQARRMGWTRRAPRLTLAVGGRVLDAARRQRGPHGELHRFLLPAGTGAVTLLSTASVPAVEDPRAADSRSLGACVTGIVFAGRPLALDGPALDVGFYPLEGGTTPRRWMGATGRLVLTPSASPALLEIAVRELRSGWHAPGLSGGLVAHPAAES